MPEGDTIHGAADRLDAALQDEEIVRAYGSHRAVREFGRRIVGSTVIEATAHGKHLLIHFSNDWTLRTHMQMTGSWHIYEIGERWRKSPGKARVVLETASKVAVCFAAPTVQLAPRHMVASKVDGLGPDLMGDLDYEALASNLRVDHAGRTICDVIIDQSAVAGLGNVYKSELLFEFGIHPDAVVERVDQATLADLLERGHKLLNANRGKPRTTTGSRAPGKSSWVYGRSGKPCRRCGTTIDYGLRGPLARHTYWCPSCQPHR